jgi:hypothetical protein
MEKKYALMTLAFLLFTLIIPAVQGSTISSVTVEIYPNKGDITTDIVVSVRGNPYAGGFLTSAGDREYPVLYVYYDDQVLESRVAPKTSGRGYGDFSDYAASWDVSVKVPNQYPYSELGQHIIRVRVDASDGSSATATANFNVVNYITPLQWWENLPQDFIQSITGARGPIGSTGATGPKGTTGTQGPKGEPGQDFPTIAMYYVITASTLALFFGIAAFITARRKS